MVRFNAGNTAYGPAIRAATYTNGDKSFHHVTMKRNVIFTTLPKPVAVMLLENMTPCAWCGHVFDVRIQEHIVTERSWKQQMVQQHFILCSNIVTYLVVVLPVKL